MEMTRRRRGKGEGSITRLADGRWQGRVDLGVQGGKRVRKAVYGRTRAEVQQRLRQLLATRDQGRPLPRAETLTVATFLDRWLTDVAARRVRPRTLERYRLDVRRLVAALGSVRLTRLTAADVQRVLNALSDQGLSPATVRHCRATLRAALNTAVVWELVPQNVAAGARVSTPAVAKAPVAAMTPALAEAILRAVDGTAVAGPVQLALLTGLRQGEVLGLRWSDVALDADPPTLTVRHQLQWVQGQWRLTPPKAAAARRVLPLPHRAVAVLRAQRRRVQELRLRAGPAWQPLPGLEDLIFPSPTGRPRDGWGVTKAFQQALHRAGLPRLRFHDLRHGYATLLVASGAPLRAVADVLGHSRVTLTAETYSHIAPAVRQELAARLDALLPPPRGAGGAPEHRQAP